MTWLKRSITMGLGASELRANTGPAACDREVTEPRPSRDCASVAASGRADDGVHSLRHSSGMDG